MDVFDGGLRWHFVMSAWLGLDKVGWRTVFLWMCLGLGLDVDVFLGWVFGAWLPVGTGIHQYGQDFLLFNGPSFTNVYCDGLTLDNLWSVALATWSGVGFAGLGGRFCGGRLGGGLQRSLLWP